MYSEEVLVLSRPEALPNTDEVFSFIFTPSKPTACHRCLVADDNPSVLRSVAGMLADLNYRVDTARDGLQALQAVSADFYDLLITDLEMPLLSGYHLAARVRQQSRDTKIILMTGHCRFELAELISTAPANAWLFKPFDWGELCRVLDDLKLPSSEALVSWAAINVQSIGF